MITEPTVKSDIKMFDIVPDITRRFDVLIVVKLLLPIVSIVM